MQARDVTFQIIGSDGVVRQVALAGLNSGLNFGPPSQDFLDSVSEHAEAVRLRTSEPSIRRSARIETPLENDEELEGLNRHDRRAILAQRRRRKWRGFSWKDK